MIAHCGDNLPSGDIWYPVVDGEQASTHCLMSLNASQFHPKTREEHTQ